MKTEPLALLRIGNDFIVLPFIPHAGLFFMSRYFLCFLLFTCGLPRYVSQYIKENLPVVKRQRVALCNKKTNYKI
jgi:hypothetical protein